MLKRAFVLAVLLFTNAAFCFAAAEDLPRLNAVQIFVFDARYKNDVGQFFKEAKAKNANAVFVRVFQNTQDKPHFGLKLACESGVYFKTDAACTVADILTPLTKAAKQHGMKIFAWMGTRSLSFLKDDANMAQAFIPDIGIGKGYGANIFKPSVRETLKKLFADLATYDIDGILFQDDFIIKYNEGADDYAIKQYKFETGQTPNPEKLFNKTFEYNGKKVYVEYTEEFYKWADWKSRKLAEFYKELMDAAKANNPDILSAANIYYETPIFPEKGLAWYSQTLERLDSAGADYFALMGYVEQIAQERSISEAEAAVFAADTAGAAVRTAIKPERVILKLQSRYFTKKREMVPPKIFSTVCIKARKYGALSYAVVPVNASEDINNACFRK